MHFWLSKQGSPSAETDRTCGKPRNPVREHSCGQQLSIQVCDRLQLFMTWLCKSSFPSCCSLTVLLAQVCLVLCGDLPGREAWGPRVAAGLRLRLQVLLGRVGVPEEE